MQNTNLKEKLVEINELVEPVIRQLLTHGVEEHNADAVFYQCRVGGKRIRPALVVLSGLLFGAKESDLLRPAASIEILHNSTLIVDDIIDHSEFRRDQPTCWHKFGKSIAECTSFIYIASIFEGINHSNNSPKLIDLYSQTIKTIIDGEVKDILFERSGREDEDFVVENRYKTISKEDYLVMISQKTAVLLQACCKAGAIVANTNDEQIEIIGDFGYNLGIAFQIRDDILDIFGDEKEFGKKIGKDIIEKKMGNYVILSALERLESDDRNIINQLLENSKEISDEDIATITFLINKTNAKQVALDTANSYVQKALSALEKLPKNEYNDTLSEVADYVVGRTK